MSTLAAVLAAGDGSRFGGPKLLVDFRGRPLVAWALDAALDAGLDETVVVIGGQALGAVVPDGVTVLGNPRWAEGQATSLQVAIARAEAAGHDAVVIGLGDSPLVVAEAWRAVAASALPDPPSRVRPRPPGASPGRLEPAPTMATRARVLMLSVPTWFPVRAPEIRGRDTEGAWSDGADQRVSGEVPVD